MHFYFIKLWYGNESAVRLFHECGESTLYEELCSSISTFLEILLASFLPASILLSTLGGKGIILPD